MLRHPQAKTGRGVHPSHNAQAKLRYLPGEDSSCLGTAVNSVDQWTRAQPAAMARLTGGRTAWRVHQERSDPLKRQSHSWPRGPDGFTAETSERGRVQAPSSAFLKPMELMRLATLSRTLPRPTATKTAENISILKCHNCIRKKNAFNLLILFLSSTDLTILNVTFKILSGL